MPVSARPDRRVIIQVAAVVAPPILIGASLAAGHTALAGGPIGGWAAPYVVVIMVGVLAALLRGPRVLPRWLENGWIVIVIGAGVLLSISEWWAPLTLVVGIVLGVIVFRAPPRTVALPPPTPFERPDVSAPTFPRADTDPGPVTAPPSPSNPVEPVTVMFVPPWGRTAFLVAGLFLLFGACWMAAMPWVIPDFPLGGRIGITAGALIPLGLGVAFLWVALKLQRTRYVLDHVGIRRIGNSPWELRWDQIAAVGVRSNEWIAPDDFTPTPATLRRRRRAWLLVRPVPPFPEAMTVLTPIDDVPGFERGDQIPQFTFGAANSPLDELDAALTRIVPERYVGLMRQGRPTPRR